LGSRNHVFRLVGHLQRECDIAAHAHMRIERIGLEHHRKAALGRANIGGVLAVDQDLTGRDVLEPCDQAEQRRLAAARGADEHREFAVLDFQIDVIDDVDGAERLAHGFEFDAAHGRLFR
jgi:hypothetical protein